MVNVEHSLKSESEICPTVTLATTNQTCPDPGHRGGKPATNRLSYGTAGYMGVRLIAHPHLLPRLSRCVSNLPPSPVHLYGIMLN
jgi:hypothetical protein